MSTSQSQLCKVIYFDEASVSDYIQIIAGGLLQTEDITREQEQHQTQVAGKAKATIVGKLISLLTVKAEMGIETQGKLEDETELLKKSVLTNTILTDFLSFVSLSDDEDTSMAVECFRKYRITAPKNSFSHMLLITPYLSMIKGGSTIPAGDVSIAMEKMDNAIKAAKGYYEFVGTGANNDKKIFRFNIKAFRNNYRLADLLKMDVSVYAIKVGRSTIDQLNANKELDIPTVSKNNPDYEENEEVAENNDSTDEIDVYDVLLAGVEHSD